MTETVSETMPKKQKIFTKDVLLLLTAVFFYGSSPMLIAPLIAGFSESLGMSAAMAGMMTGIMYLSSLFSRPYFGHLADRKTKSFLMKWGLAVMAVSVLLTAASVAGWIILIARLLNGVGYCMCSISITAWLAALFPRNRTGTGMGCYGMINALANAAAPMLALQIASLLGDRNAFVTSFLFLAIAFALVSLVQRKGDPAPAAPVRSRLLFSKPALPFAGIIMCFTIPFYATTAFLVEYTAQKGWSASPSLYFLVYSIALLVLRALLKDQFDKRPFKIFYWASLACSFAACALLNYGDSTFVYSLAGIAMAGGYGIMSSECQSAAILVTDPACSGLASSTFYIGIDLGLLLGPSFAGETIQQFGIGLLYPLLSVVMILSLLIYLASRKKISSIH